MDYCKNQIYDVAITDISETGEGIGRIDGYTLFVKDAVVGDYIKARLTKVKKNYAFARLEEIITPSDKRCQPVCELYKRCGGCQIQAISYDAQLEFKRNKVYGNLKRIGGFDEALLDKIFEPIVGMEDPLRYRNKAQYPIGTDKAGNVIAGFYAGRTHEIIPCKDCMLGVKENQTVLDIILKHMKENNISAYDENTGKGLVRHVLIRKGFATGQIMVCLVVSKPGKTVNPKAGKDADTKPGKAVIFLKGQEALVDALAKIPGMSSISVSVNSENTNVIMGKTVETIWGKDYIEDVLLGKTYQISPLAFYQVNPVQCAKLYKTVEEYAELTGSEEVWDICCGIGTIALSLADKAAVVHGIEIVPEAIEDAVNNARLNGVENADFFCADATPYLLENAGKMKADVIVMDPPRKGMTEDALKSVISVGPEKLVYVSCDSATLARDLKILCANGYELKRVRPVDMFPHSVHVETVCLLVNQKAKHHINIGIDIEEYDRIKNR